MKKYPSSLQRAGLCVGRRFVIGFREGWRLGIDARVRLAYGLSQVKVARLLSAVFWCQAPRPDPLVEYLSGFGITVHPFVHISGCGVDAQNHLFLTQFPHHVVLGDE